MTISRTRTAIAGGLLAAMVLAGCSRSEPEQPPTDTNMVEDTGVTETGLISGARTVSPFATVASTISGGQVGSPFSNRSASSAGFSRRTQPWLESRLKLANFARLGVSWR